MTFLLFLASVAVLEYILRRDRTAPGPPARKEQSSTGLLSLAQSVEQQGAGPAPAANSANAVSEAAQPERPDQTQRLNC